MEKALDYLYSMKKANEDMGTEPITICEAIKELDAYITNYQGIKRRLDNTVTTLAVLQNENKSLVKTLEKMNEEMIDLRKENQDLKNSNNELLEGLISTQKRLEEWLEKCK